MSGIFVTANAISHKSVGNKEHCVLVVRKILRAAHVNKQGSFWCSTADIIMITLSFLPNL